MTRRWYAHLMIAPALAAAPLVACGDSDGANGATGPTEPTGPTASTAVAPTQPDRTIVPVAPPVSKPPRATTTTVTGSTPDPSLSDRDYAIADLRGRVGEQGEIEVVSHDEVTWPDGGLGCPQPGWSYTQALVNGTRIVLRHDGVLYEYHAGGRRRPFYCPPELVHPPAEGATADPEPGGA